MHQLNSNKRFKKWYFIGMGLFLTVAFIGMAGLILVRTNASVAWRFDNLMAKVKYALNPPEKVIFVPQDQISLMVSATLKGINPLNHSDPRSDTRCHPHPGYDTTHTHCHAYSYSGPKDTDWFPA